MLAQVAAGMAVAGSARAQAAYPDHALRLVVGYPPGGASDLFARLLAAHMATRFGHNVVVENKPGGGAVLASETVTRAPADGYTILHVDNGILTYNPALYARLPYDPDRDLTGFGFIGRFPLFLMVRPDHPSNSFAELVARSKNGTLAYASPAVASPHHLAMEMVKRRTGLEATHVPYRGTPAAVQDLLAGNVESAVVDCATGTPYITSGRVKTLCCFSEARSPTAREVPTLRELGFANAVAYGWQGMSVAAATPAPIVAKLNEALLAAVSADDVQARFRDLGVENRASTPAEFAAFVAQENAQWRPLIRELGIKLDS
jgi:tripartite-type tricarboxylate transporter receptor subunit TctC